MLVAYTTEPTTVGEPANTPAGSPPGATNDNDDAHVAAPHPAPSKPTTSDPDPTNTRPSGVNTGPATTSAPTGADHCRAPEPGSNATNPNSFAPVDTTSNTDAPTAAGATPDTVDPVDTDHNAPQTLAPTGPEQPDTPSASNANNDPPAFTYTVLPLTTGGPNGPGGKNATNTGEQPDASQFTECAASNPSNSSTDDPATDTNTVDAGVDVDATAGTPPTGEPANPSDHDTAPDDASTASNASPDCTNNRPPDVTT